MSICQASAYHGGHMRQALIRWRPTVSVGTQYQLSRRGHLQSVHSTSSALQHFVGKCGFPKSGSTLRLDPVWCGLSRDMIKEKNENNQGRNNPRGRPKPELWLRDLGADLHRRRSCWLGETWYGPMAVEGAVHELFAPMLIGRNPLNIENHWHNMFRLADHWGYGGAETRAISALDIALWDIAGQASGRPIMRCSAVPAETESAFTILVVPLIPCLMRQSFLSAGSST